jgi:hypothetical protein
MNMLQFLQDASGQNSSMRLMVFVVVIAIIGVWLVGNVGMVWNAIAHGGPLAFVPMDDKMVWALGVALAGKVGQAAIENKPEPKQ